MAKFKNEMFKKIVLDLKSDIQFIEDISNLNEILQSKRWPFIHPYNYVAEIRAIREAITSHNSEERVFAIYARGFLDLRTTSAFMEGFFKIRPIMKDYIYLVDSSIILCLQKDFAGAINTLIPAIEGMLRDYLVSKGKESTRLINVDSLLDIERVLSAEYCNIQMNNLDPSIDGKLDRNQLKVIKTLHSKYVTIWLRQLTKYLKSSLYADTRITENLDKLNRHNIFHGFNNDTYYSFSNYLRIFNCLNFISWIFGLVYIVQSVLVQADESKINKRWKYYTRILAVNKALESTKIGLLGKDPSRSVDFSIYMDQFLKYPFDKTEKAVKTSFRYTNRYFNW